MRSFVRPTPLTDRVYDYALSIGLREPDMRTHRCDPSHNRLKIA